MSTEAIEEDDGHDKATVLITTEGSASKDCQDDIGPNQVSMSDAAFQELKD